MPNLIREQGRNLRNSSNKTVTKAIHIWHQAVIPGDLDRSFAAAAPDMLLLIGQSQNDVAQEAWETTPDAMRAIDHRPLPARGFDFDTTILNGTAGNGQALFDVFYGSILTAKRQIGEGTDSRIAVMQIDADMARLIRTALADTSRTASLMSAKSFNFDACYVRALTPPSCGRCAILAGMPSGKKPFERHPYCDCIAMWCRDEKMLMTHFSSANDYLDSLDDKQLAHVLGSQANARAWKDGADLNKLVNAYRKRGDVRPAQLYGRNIKYTTESTTKRGTGYWMVKKAGYVKTMHRDGSKYFRVDRPRLMPETIYQIAGNDHAKAMKLLKNYGWLGLAA